MADHSIAGVPVVPVGLTMEWFSRIARAFRPELAERSAETAAAGQVPDDVARRLAETALEELLGIVSVDDVLDVVFREFCIGK